MDQNAWDAHDLSVHGAVPIDTLRKWLSGTSNPTERRLSDVIARAGGDPTEFGLRPAAADSALEPAWVARLEEKLDRIIANQEKLAR